ncbi:MAG: hypothetical protein GF384_08845 [Elusimicrobia bacterium]|nr:hypothetical protein [Elusimicrobiota bacterium]
MRWLKVVNDRRIGTHVYYSLNRKKDGYALFRIIMSHTKHIAVFRKDLRKLKRFSHKQCT